MRSHCLPEGETGMCLYADGVSVRPRSTNEEREKGCNGCARVGLGTGV